MDQAHQRNAAPNDFRRFFDSKGVDVFKNAGEKGDAYSLCLHKETEAIASQASTEAIQCMVEYEDIIALGRGNQVFITSDNFATVTELVKSQERLVRGTFQIKMYGYIVPDIIQKELNSVKKFNEKSKIIFGMETDSGDERFQANPTTTPDGRTRLNPDGETSVSNLKY